MGRTSDEEGETSTKVCKSDDIEDRPLKKARYVWQIKGKYHLKKPNDEKVTYLPAKSPVADECSSVGLQCKYSTCKADSNCDTELTTMEVADNTTAFKTSNTSEVETNIGRHQFPDAPDREDRCIKNTKQVSENIPLSQPEWPAAAVNSLPNSRPASSWQLRKWQARQVARCFVDNTINRVLEDMGFVPLPVDADDILDEFPMTESENDDGLEDEAVLMAIHRHGLRTEGESNGSATDNKSLAGAPPETNQQETASGMPCVCTITPRQDLNPFFNFDPFHHRPVFWDQGEMDTQKLLHSPFTSELNSNEIVHRWFSDGLFSSVINSESSSDSDVKTYDETMSDEQTPTKEKVSTSSIDNVQDNSMITDGSGETSVAEKTPDGGSVPSFEHSDFLDKAVAVAIQKKGLSKLSCADYG